MRDQNLAEENDIFEEEKETQRKENVNLLRRQKELELEVEHLKGELQVCEHYYYYFLNASFFAGCRCVSWCFCLVVSSGCSSRLCSAVGNTTGSHWLDRDLVFPSAGHAGSVVTCIVVPAAPSLPWVYVAACCCT